MGKPSTDLAPSTKWTDSSYVCMKEASSQTRNVFARNWQEGGCGVRRVFTLAGTTPKRASQARNGAQVWDGPLGSQTSLIRGTS